LFVHHLEHGDTLSLMSIYTNASRFLKRSVPFVLLFAVSCKKSLFSEDKVGGEYEFDEAFALSNATIICRDGVFKAYKDNAKSLKELGIDQIVVLHSTSLTRAQLATLYSHNAVETLASMTNLQVYKIDAGSEQEIALASTNGIDLELFAAAKSFAQVATHGVLLASQKGSIGMDYTCAADGGGTIIDSDSSSDTGGPGTVIPPDDANSSDTEGGAVIPPDDANSSDTGGAVIPPDDSNSSEESVVVQDDATSS
jgi:hypothetical protein